MEVEIKGKMPKNIRPKSLGWKFIRRISEMDLYFSHPCRDFSFTDEALRVRFSSDGKVEITYKGPKVDEITKSREEINCQVSGPSILRLLEGLGFREVGKIEKNREVYEKGGLRLYLDEVWGEICGKRIYLGKYVEVEGIGKYEELLEKIISEAKKLGIKELERRSYLELLVSSSKS